MSASEPAPEPALDRFPDAYSLGKWEEQLEAVAVMLGLVEPEEEEA